MSDLSSRRLAAWRADDSKDNIIVNDSDVAFKHPSTSSVYMKRQNSITHISSLSLDRDQYREHSTDFRKPIIFSVLQEKDMHDSGVNNHEPRPNHQNFNRTLTPHTKRNHIHEPQRKSVRGGDSMQWAPHPRLSNYAATSVSMSTNHRSHGDVRHPGSQPLSSNGNTRSGTKDRELSKSYGDIHRHTDPDNTVYGVGWMKDFGTSNRRKDAYKSHVLSPKLAHQRDLFGHDHYFSSVPTRSRDEDYSFPHRKPASKSNHKTTSKYNSSGHPPRTLHPQTDFHHHGHNQHPATHQMDVYDGYNQDPHSYHNNTGNNSDLISASPNPSSYNYNSRVLPKRESRPKNFDDFTVKEGKVIQSSTTTHGAKLNEHSTNVKTAMNSRKSKLSPSNAVSGKPLTDIPDVLMFHGNNIWNDVPASSKEGETNVDAGRGLREQFDDEQRKRRRNHVIFMFVVLIIIVIAVVSAVLASTLGLKTGKSPYSGGKNFTVVIANLTLKILNRNFNDDLLTFGSDAFQNLAIPYSVELDELFLKSSLAHVYSRNEILSFRNGSIYATSSITFVDKGLISSPRDVENVIESADVARDWKTADALQLGEFVVCRSCVEAKIEYLNVTEQPEVLLHIIGPATSTVRDTTNDKITTMTTTTISSTPLPFSSTTTTDEIAVSERQLTNISTTSSTVETNSTSAPMSSESTSATTTTNFRTSLSPGESNTTTDKVMVSKREEFLTTKKEDVSITFMNENTTSVRELTTTTSNGINATTTEGTLTTPSVETTTTTTTERALTTRSVGTTTTPTTELALTTTTERATTTTTTKGATSTTTEGKTSTTTDEVTTTTTERPMTAKTQNVTTTKTELTSSTTAKEWINSTTTASTTSRTEPGTNTTSPSTAVTNTSPKPSPTVITVSDVSATSTDGSVTVTCFIANPNDFSAVNILHTPLGSGNNSKEMTRTIVRLDTRDLYVVATISPVYNDRVRVVYEVSQSHIDIKLNISNLGCYDDGYIECSLAGRTVSKTSGRGRLEVTEPPSAPKLVMPVEVVANVEMTQPITCQADVGYPAWRLKLTAQMSEGAVPHELLTEQEKMVNGCRTTVILKLRPYTPTYSSNGTIIRCELERPGENVGAGEVKVDTGVLLVVGGSVCKGKADNSILRHPYNCSSYITCLNQQPKVSSCPGGQCFDTVSGQCGMKAIIAESTNGFLNEGLAGVTCSVIHVSDWSEIVIGREVLLSKSVDILSVSATGNVTWHDLSISMRGIANFRVNSLEAVLEMWLYVLKCGDEGTYTCSVRGPTALRDGRAELKVYAKPEPPILVVPRTFVENNPQAPVITCEANLGRPAATMTLMRRLPNQLTFEPVNFTDTSPEKSNVCVSKSKRVHVTSASASLNGTIFRCDVSSSVEALEKVHLSSEEIELYVLTAKTCQGVGSTLLVHHKDCRYFVQCVQSETTVLSCGPGLCFNVNSQQCDILTPTSSPFIKDEFCALENSSGYKPHPLLCNKYFRCETGREIIQHCPQGQLYSKDGSCSSNIHESFCFNAMLE